MVFHLLLFPAVVLNPINFFALFRVQSTDSILRHLGLPCDVPVARLIELESKEKRDVYLLGIIVDFELCAPARI
jgi:hypothetical protein